MSESKLILYVSCGETLEIRHFAMDRENGALQRCGVTVLPGAPPAASPNTALSKPSLRSNGAPLAISPDGGMLYVAMRTKPARVLSYRIDRESGSLSLIGEAPIPPLTPYIATDRTGCFLLGAEYQGGLVWVSQVESSGAVTAPPIEIVEGMITAHSVMLHPANDIAYVGATGLNEVQTFRFDAKAGALSAHGAAPVLAGAQTPRHLAIHSSGQFLYCVNETSSIVDAYAIDAESRALMLLQSVDPRPPEHRDAPGLGADIHASRNGRFLYCSERTRGTISAYEIDENSGRLSFIQTIVVGSIPRSFALDPSDRFLIAAAQGDGVIIVFAIEADNGRLTRLDSHVIGGSPIWVEFVDLQAAVAG